MHLGILGGGPVGVEMAVAAVRSGLAVTLLERGQQVGTNVLAWGQVKLFSPNALNHSPAGLAVLKEMGVPTPDQDKFPTGDQYVSEYLAHLGRYLGQCGRCKVLLCTKVISVGRGSLLKGQDCTQSRERGMRQFRVLVETQAGEEMIEGFDAIVDATGTYGNHNWLGRGGIPAKGERKLANKIFYTIPDVESVDTFHGQEVPKVSMVIGGGASAVTTLAMLQRLGKEKGGVEVVWLTRRDTGEPYTVKENDPLPQREALYTLGNKLAAGKELSGFDSFQYLGNCGVVEVREEETGMVEVVVKKEDSWEVEVVKVDNVIAHIGYRPDTSLTQELQVHYCYATEGPMKLAAALMAAGGGGGDCLAQVAPGPDMLRTPEPGFFVLGMKSYGRGSAFLLKIGQEQVQQVMQILEK